MHTLMALWLAGCGFSPTTARAEMTASATVVSDYDYRGVSQTASDPAVQIGTGYTGNHIHLEVWSSNVKFDTTPGFFDSRHSEVAYSASLLAGSDALVSYEIGVDYFTYPGWHPNLDYPEVVATVAHGAISSSLHYTWEYSNQRPQLAAYYLEANDSCQLRHWGLKAIVHVGLSWGEYWNLYNGGKYADLSLGIQREFRYATVTAQVVDTAGYVPIPHGQPFSGKARMIVSVSMEMPFRK